MTATEVSSDHRRFIGRLHHLCEDVGTSWIENNRRPSRSNRRQVTLIKMLPCAPDLLRGDLLLAATEPTAGTRGSDANVCAFDQQVSFHRSYGTTIA